MSKHIGLLAVVVVSFALSPHIVPVQRERFSNEKSVIVDVPALATKDLGRERAREEASRSPCIRDLLAVLQFLDTVDRSGQRIGGQGTRFVSTHNARTVAVEEEAFEKLRVTTRRMDGLKDQVGSHKANSQELLEPRVQLACWRIVQGELLALSSISRLSNSSRELTIGMLELAQLTETDFMRLEKDHPETAFVAEVVLARQSENVATLHRNTLVITAENERKTKLLRMYRDLLGQYMHANQRLNMGEYSEAAKGFETAGGHASILQDEVSTFDRDVGNSLNRRPFLFNSEPSGLEVNPSPLPYLEDEELASVIPVLSAFAVVESLGEVQESSSQEFQDAIDHSLLTLGEDPKLQQNSFAQVIRALLYEHRLVGLGAELLQNDDGDTAQLLQRYRETREQSALLVAQSGLSRGDVTNRSQPKLRVLASKLQERVGLVSAMQRALYGYLADRQIPQARQTSRAMLLRHYDSYDVWQDYVFTELLSGSGDRRLEQEIDLASKRGVLEPQQHKALLAQVLLARGRAKLSTHDQLLKLIILDSEMQPDFETAVGESSQLFRQAIECTLSSGVELREVGREPLQATYLFSRALLFAIDRRARTNTELQELHGDLTELQDAIAPQLQDLRQPTRETIQGRAALAVVHYSRALLWSTSPAGHDAHEVNASIGLALDLWGQQFYPSETSTLLLGTRESSQEGSLRRERGLRDTFQFLIEAHVLKDLGNFVLADQRVSQAKRVLKAAGHLERSPVSYVWQVLTSSKQAVSIQDAERLVGILGLQFELERISSPYSRFAGDLIEVKPEEANEFGKMAMMVVDPDGARAFEPSNVYDSIREVVNPFDALAIAIAAETQLRTLAIADESRSEWAETARAALERFDELNTRVDREFERQFPVLHLAAKAMAERFSDDLEVQWRVYQSPAAKAARTFGFEEATARLRDAVIHHPGQEHLWASLVEVMLTELELMTGEAGSAIRVDSEKSRELSFALRAWTDQLPDDSWQRSLAWAKYFQVMQHSADWEAASRRALELALATNDQEGAAMAAAMMAQAIVP